MIVKTDGSFAALVLSSTVLHRVPLPSGDTGDSGSGLPIATQHTLSSPPDTRPATTTHHTLIRLNFTRLDVDVFIFKAGLLVLD